MRRILVLALTLAALVAGCGSDVRRVEYGSHRVTSETRGAIAEYPPPPAEVEELPPAPQDPACVWLDGYWEWSRRRWTWSEGAWVVPPQACYFAQPYSTWIRSGDQSVLQYLAPAWYPIDPGARFACATPRPC